MQGGPEPCELVRLLEVCDLSNSYCTTPCLSPSPLTPAPAPALLHRPGPPHHPHPYPAACLGAGGVIGGPQVHPGPLLKPANVAFLSHNQSAAASLLHQSTPNSFPHQSSASHSQTSITHSQATSSHSQPTTSHNQLASADNQSVARNSAATATDDEDEGTAC